MNTAPSVLKRKQRLDLLFELLKERAAKFENHTAAYVHLVECLDEVEYQQPGLREENMMYLDELPQFNFFKIIGVFRLNTRGHSIFINKNGAYGIYEKPEMEIPGSAAQPNIDVELYKKTNPLVLFPNEFGKPLW